MEFRHNIPVGTKIDCVKITGTNGGSCPGATREAEVFLVADNAYGKLDLSLVAIPEGYELAGEKPEEWFREPNIDEFYRSDDEEYGPRSAQIFYGVSQLRGTDFRRIIIRKKATKKRFLVGEWEIVSGGSFLGHEGLMGAFESEHLLKTYKHYRIEEREVA